MNMTSYAVRATLLVASLALLVACGGEGSPSRSGSDSTTGSDSGSPTPAEARTLTVFAAASLQEPFETIGADFAEANPGVTVRFSFGGSSGLVAQLSDGAPADVLATANEPTMGKAVAEDLIDGNPAPFATNTLQIAVPKDNPASITSLADLTKEGVNVVLCAPAVPCGAASVAVEKAAGIDIKPVSEEQSVTDVLGKVRSGEADAGLVYVTDVRKSGGDVTGIDFPESKEVVNVYPIASLKDATDAALADAFVAAVTAPDGLEVLAEAGFLAP